MLSVMLPLIEPRMYPAPLVLTYKSATLQRLSSAIKGSHSVTKACCALTIIFEAKDGNGAEVDVEHLPRVLDQIAPRIVRRVLTTQEANSSTPSVSAPCRLESKVAFSSLSTDKYHYYMPLRAGFCAACGSVCGGDGKGGKCRLMKQLLKQQAKKAEAKRQSKAARATRQPERAASSGSAPQPDGWGDQQQYDI